jgi:glutamyl-tRNA reductase
MLSFVAIGLDHTTAGIELRERVAFADTEIPAALHRLTDPGNQLLDQAAILPTCNRVELYGVARSRPAERRLAAFLAQSHGLDPSEVAIKLYVYSGDHDRPARRGLATG